MKTAKKNPPKPAATTEPSADASARFKRLVAESRKSKKTSTTSDDPPPAAPNAVAPPDDSPSAPAPAFVPSAEDATAGPAPFATLKDLGATWIEYLKANAAAVSTWASYLHDFETAAEHFGPDTDPVTLSAEAVAAYEVSEAVTKTKKGRAKSQPTILKTRRVLRLALTWAHDSGRLAAIPYASRKAAS